MGVRVGVEWTNVFHQHDAECRFPDLKYSADVAQGFLLAMRSCGHDDIFDWGDDNAWSSDFDHPSFGGDSLDWTDNVHFCCFAGHGGQFSFEGQPALNLAFPTRHNPPDLASCTLPAWKLIVGDRCFSKCSTTCSVLRSGVKFRAGS